MHIPADPNLRWNAARIPVQRRGVLLDDLAFPSTVIKPAQAFVDTFPQRFVPEDTPLSEYPEDRSLIGVGATLIGHQKAGKTSVGCAILTEIAVNSAGAVTLLYTPWADYMHAFNERHAWRSLSAGNFLDQMVNLSNFEASASEVMGASLVMLDDIGHEHTTASNAARDELGRVLRSRHRRGLVTILATSLVPKSLEEQYGPDLTELMLRTFTPIHIAVR